MLKRWCKELAIASKDETARESSARMLKEKRHNAIILDVDWNEQLGYTGYTSKSLIQYNTIQYNVLYFERVDIHD